MTTKLFDGKLHLLPIEIWMYHFYGPNDFAAGKQPFTLQIVFNSDIKQN